jgi:hypothetical protein
MKRQIATALALGLFAVTLAASVADAQTGRHRVGPSAAAARAQAPHASATQRAPESPAVYEWGKYQGQDPDPNVRLMLRKDVHN